jgi:hypothetical protein
MATWDDWSARYEAAYQAVPDDLHKPCPNCGMDSLHLVFTGHASTAVGYASSWCDSCPRIPNFHLVE